MPRCFNVIRLLSLSSCLALVLSMAGCHAGGKPRLWIYTSMYKEVIAEMNPALERAFPEVEVRFFQGGSENVAARLSTELYAGRTQADLVMTSDPFWYLELKKSGKLLPYESPAAKNVSPDLKDPDHAFVTVRLPVMVVARRSDFSDTSASWKDLAQPNMKERLSMGSPLESGTSFMAVAMLSEALGWDYFKKLRELNVIAAGGNSSVINRIETRERPVGIVLLENILKARKKGSPVQEVYPAEGAIAVPSPIAILSDTRHPELAKKVYDWFFTDEAQRAITRSWMYSPLPGIPAPQGARPWNELKRLAWSPAVLERLYEKREEMKRRFAQEVLQ